MQLVLDFFPARIKLLQEGSLCRQKRCRRRRRGERDRRRHRRGDGRRRQRGHRRRGRRVLHLRVSSVSVCFNRKLELKLFSEKSSFHL